MHLTTTSVLFATASPTSLETTLERARAAGIAAAGLSPEVEKPDLLPPRPEELGASEAGGPQAASGCPFGGFTAPAAFDLAVTSGLRAGTAAASAADGGQAVASYEDRKRSFQRTKARCRATGLQFVPLIAEAWKFGIISGPC